VKGWWRSVVKGSLGERVVKGSLGERVNTMDLKFIPLGILGSNPRASIVSGSPIGVFPVLPLSAHRFHCVKDPKNCHFWGNKGYPFPKVKIFSRKAVYGFPSEKDPKRCRFHRVVSIESFSSSRFHRVVFIELAHSPVGRDSKKAG
jgi:hypothetical protein